MILSMAFVRRGPTRIAQHDGLAVLDMLQNEQLFSRGKGFLSARDQSLRV